MAYASGAESLNDWQMVSSMPARTEGKCAQQYLFKGVDEMKAHSDLQLQQLLQT